MNYKTIYDKLIYRAQQRITIDEFENHHIIPRCMGGDNDPKNIVKLTLEEHYIAHQLLVKIYPNHKGLVYAAIMMCAGRKSNKLYGWLRRRYNLVAKQRLGAKNGSFGKKWYTNPITLENGKFTDCDIPTGWVKGRYVKKISETKKTTKCIVCSDDTKSHKAKWCNNCKPAGPIRQKKQKMYFSDEEKISALRLFDGKIRPALFHLGLNDSGVHYRYMKKLKASVYPLATNQLKG